MRLLNEPRTCLMGVYLQDMRDYKFADRSLFASIRLWSVCPSEADSPLSDLDVLNSNGVNISEIHPRSRPMNLAIFRIVRWCTGLSAAARLNTKKPPGISQGA